MSDTHPFLLVPGIWLGEGQIILNMADEKLAYFTRWKVSEKDGEGKIMAIQEVEIKGLADIMHNEFIFSEVSSKNFLVTFENESIGSASGRGFITQKMIGWEFSDQSKELEGFEFYERREDTNYLVHAEYATADQFRTEIRGKIWKKAVT